MTHHINTLSTHMEDLKGVSINRNDVMAGYGGDFLLSYCQKVPK
jgi:hypothetical protein